ncbi:hypothetical protein BGX24_003973, partial [Mortierella sp. AD032]
MKMVIEAEDDEDDEDSYFGAGTLERVWWYSCEGSSGYCLVFGQVEVGLDPRN